MTYLYFPRIYSFYRKLNNVILTLADLSYKKSERSERKCPMQILSSNNTVVDGTIIFTMMQKKHEIQQIAHPI